MARKVRIKAGQVEAIAELNESQTAQAIWEALPITGNVNTWGDEIYFSILVDLSQENAQGEVQIGDLGYWPEGSAFCIFFGPTPASTGNEIRPASPVNVFGKIIGDPKVFQQVTDGEEVAIEALDE